jgi:hypothetical protein
MGWIAAATHIIQVACSSSLASAYVNQAQRLQETVEQMGYLAHRHVWSMGEILKQSLADIDRGLLQTLERQVSSETFDDLIDHADAYLGEGRKDPAGVIAGVVFEDTIRRLCRANGINDVGKTLDPMISDLANGRILTSLEAKEARAAAGLRTSATHALWSEFTADQVRATVTLTRRLIREKLNP